MEATPPRTMAEARQRLSSLSRPGPAVKYLSNSKPYQSRKRSLKRRRWRKLGLFGMIGMFGLGLFADEIRPRFNNFVEGPVGRRMFAVLHKNNNSDDDDDQYHKEMVATLQHLRKQYSKQAASSTNNGITNSATPSKKDPPPLNAGQRLATGGSGNTTSAPRRLSLRQQKPQKQKVIDTNDERESQMNTRISRSIHGANNFVARRRDIYKRAGRLSQWAFRGVGYLYTHHGIVLSGMLPDSEEIHPGRNVVQIYDVNTPHRTDCHLLTIWVRVNGPEIFAGSAKAVKKPQVDSCYWEFSFDLSLPGEYSVDAKLLTWNGSAEGNDPNNMPIRKGKDVPWTKYPHHASIIGFKMYDPPHSCCEACSRTPGCVYWSSPALHFDHKWGCEFYFNSSDEELLAPFQYYTPDIQKQYVTQELRNKTNHHGTPHSNPMTYFMGCGWNFYLSGVSQCEHPLDDSVYIGGHKFRLDDPVATPNLRPERNLPSCDLEQHESLNGRWVREEYPSALTCPREMDNRKEIYSRLKHHNLLMFETSNPHCWFRDDLSTLGTRCFVSGCGTNKKYIWRSALAEEKQWHGMWKNYACDYVELTNKQLQQCIDQRKIVSIQTRGKSVAAYTNEYLQQRLSHVKFFDAEASGTPKEETLNVTLDTFGAPHLMWHNSSAEWRREFQEYPSPKPFEENFYAEAMYFVSEREPFCTAPRAQMINRDMEDILVPKGFKKLSTFDMSSAFSFDSATQMDGLHIIGPPLRMVITKLFHYICKDHMYPDPAKVATWRE
eukprot:CAMPEP_0168749362 /NCGR_PEP_ID=MMETSP0724-20121128/16677_1 /TAXON_ID=265536 /ORGANISM="Amphiprora sp., Strain CCMP467" /LENGTH=773 /DNA_ID=CAMNT_0008797269 /DNA_START=253 /DNA_END=2574 /DNA_ORIENTATION=-